MSYPATSRAPELLICDDSLTERTAAARVLRQAGYEVHEAGDGPSALLLLQSREIDLVLLDLNMPDLDGFEVLTTLQTHAPGLPVILMSGMAPNQIQHRLSRLPSTELPVLLLKPIDVDQMLDVIELRLAGELPQDRGRS